MINSNDIIVLATNGLWNNVPLNVLHYELRGPGSYRVSKNSKDFPDEEGGERRSLKDMAERIGKIGGICSRKGNYESPVYMKAMAEGI